MAHMNHWKNTKKEKHKENCLHRSSTENLKAFRVIHRLRFQGQCFRGLLFSTSDRGQRDTKQVVGNLISLCNITSGVMCFREIRATLTIWNCFKSGGGASVQQRKQNSFIISWYYSEKKKEIDWEQDTTKRTVTFETMCDKQSLQISRGACTSSILTSPKREIDRVNQLSELTTCWHKFVSFLVLGLPWVPRVVFILTRAKSLWKWALFL